MDFSTLVRSSLQGPTKMFQTQSYFQVLLDFPHQFNQHAYPTYKADLKL